MSAKLVERLEGLIPFLEAHHCDAEAIREVLAERERLRDAGDELADKAWVAHFELTDAKSRDAVEAACERWIAALAQPPASSSEKE